MKLLLDGYRALSNKPEDYEKAAKNIYDLLKNQFRRKYRIIKTSLDLCTRCGICTTQCFLYETTGEEIYNPIYRINLLRKLIHERKSRFYSIFHRGRKNKDNMITAEELHALAENIYRCNMCRRCSMACPFKVDNALIVREVRDLLSRLNIAPRDLHEYGALRQLKYDAVISMNKAAFLDIVKFMEEEIKEKRGFKIEIPVDKKGAEYLLLNVASDYIRILEDVMGIIEVLDYLGVDYTLSTEFNDASNYGVFYNDDYLAQIIRRHIEVAKKLEVKKIVVGECGHATLSLRVFKDVVPEAREFEVISVLELVDEYLRRGKLNLDPSKNRELVTYHDPCFLTRIIGLIEEPRRLLKASVLNFVEMEPNREYNYCCGGGGGIAVMYSNNFLEWRMKVSGRKKVEQIEKTGAKIVATACSNCKRQLKDLAFHYKAKWEVYGVLRLVANALVY